MVLFLAMKKRLEFRKLVSIDEAKNIIHRLNITPRILETDILNAYGKTLATDVISEVDVPPFNRASMDGYAVHASDTYHAREDSPVILKLVGSIPPGINHDIHIHKGEAVEISTGAVMPSGANAVVMVEYTSSSDNEIRIYRPVSINENVMQAGTDIMIGERVLKKGSVIGVREIGVLAAIGRTRVPVYGLNVGIISTGDELTQLGDKLEMGKIYDINSYTLSSGVMECGATPVCYGIVNDDENKLKEVLKKAAHDCDMILTSGSTSTGSGDMMHSVIEENGKVLVHGINIKPGKPVIIGKIFGKPVFGLPGYPTSCLTIFNEFIAPVIRKITGKKHEGMYVKARLSSRIRSEGRSQLLPVGIVRDRAYPIYKGSGAITTLSEADGFIRIPEDVEIMEAGESIKVTLYQKPEAYDLLFIGSHCLGIDVLFDIINLKVRVINTGSTGGLNAIKKGIAHIAGVHLLDESGEYNIPFLKRYHIKAVVIKGYVREQGLILPKDSEIKSLEDIIDSNSRIINRNTGSGTRLLTDLKLKEVAKKKGIPFEELIKKIKGYDTEAKTHSAVAAAVKFGKADAGVGIRTVAEMNKLRFIKIADEEYDFVIPYELLDTKEIKTFIKALCSKQFKNKLPSGLRTYERTGEIIQV